MTMIDKNIIDVEKEVIKEDLVDSKQEEKEYEEHANDGMRYPSIDQLVTRTTSKYRLVIGAAVRARQIERGEEVQIKKPVSKKPIGIALEEIYQGKVEIK